MPEVKDVPIHVPGEGSAVLGLPYQFSGQEAVDFTRDLLGRLVGGGQKIELLVNCNGGSVCDTVGLMAILRHSEYAERITAVAIGGVYCAGVSIFCTAKRRAIAPGAQFGIHAPVASHPETSIAGLPREAYESDLLGQVGDMGMPLVLNTDLPAKVIQDYYGQSPIAGWKYFSADEAMGLGFGTHWFLNPPR